jgi:hypothetical protein
MSVVSTEITLKNMTDVGNAKRRWREGDSHHFSRFGKQKPDRVPNAGLAASFGLTSETTPTSIYMLMQKARIVKGWRGG